MNQRIQQLALEAEVFAKQNNGDFHYFYTRKLAELIVRECVEVCNRVYFDNYPDAEDFERSEEGDAIKKHFGVEE